MEVAALVIDGNMVTRDVVTCAAAVAAGRKVTMMDRRVAQFMASCDLGPHWQKLAELPPLAIFAPEATEKG